MTARRALVGNAGRPVEMPDADGLLIGGSSGFLLKNSSGKPVFRDSGDASTVYPATTRVWQMMLTPLGVNISTGYKGPAAAGFAGTITGVTIDCDPNNKPTAADIYVDLYKVDRSTGTRTSVLSAQAVCSIGGTTGSGTLSGTPTVTATDLLEARVVQGTTGQNLSIKVTIAES